MIGLSRIGFYLSESCFLSSDHHVSSRYCAKKIVTNNTTYEDSYEPSSRPALTLPYKVKMQYVQISNLIDTSIKYPISGQSISTVNGCMDIMFDIVDTAVPLVQLKSTDHLLAYR